jgi:hypothetical protein
MGERELVSHDQYIWAAENAVPEELCDRACRFLEQYASEAQSTSYGTGENTFCKKIVLADELSTTEMPYALDGTSLRNALIECLTHFMQKSIIPATYPLAEPVFAPLEIRKMLGPTRNHSDNVSPFLLTMSGRPRIAYRVVSIIMTMSHSDDILYFPGQDRRLKLQRASIACFPPYWMFEHSSLDGGAPRYSVTTWLNETTDAITAPFLAPR